MPKCKAKKIADAAGIQRYIRKHYLAMYAKWSRRTKQGFYQGN